MNKKPVCLCVAQCQKNKKKQSCLTNFRILLYIYMHIFDTYIAEDSSQHRSAAFQNKTMKLVTHHDTVFPLNSIPSNLAVSASTGILSVL